MSERLSPWRAKPSQEGHGNRKSAMLVWSTACQACPVSLQRVTKLIAALPETQLFLVQRQGPMSFVLCEDAAKPNCKVLLGPQPSCSCRSDYLKYVRNAWCQLVCSLPLRICMCRKDGGKELCIHHIFVMLRVLGLSANNPLIWQTSLTGTLLAASPVGHENLIW